MPGGLATFLYSFICSPCAAGDVAEHVEPGSWCMRCCCPCCCCLAADRTKLAGRMGVMEDSSTACILTLFCRELCGLRGLCFSARLSLHAFAHVRAACFFFMFCSPVRHNPGEARDPHRHGDWRTQVRRAQYMNARVS